MSVWGVVVAVYAVGVVYMLIWMGRRTRAYANGCVEFISWGFVSTLWPFFLYMVLRGQGGGRNGT